MKLVRRWQIYLKISAVFLIGLFVILFMPGRVEGVYAPFSSMGCDCDQFMEFRDGRVVNYVMDSADADLMAVYKREAAAGIIVRLSVAGAGGNNQILARAEPHLLGTRFFYCGDGKSEWKWKRYVTAGMRQHIKEAVIVDFRKNVGNH